MKNNINLLIPVYDGGAYFQECLDSIAPHLDLFDYIIISINKSKNQQDDIDICNNFIKNNSNCKFKQFIRDKTYSARQHGLEIYKYLKKDCDLQNSFIMHLCHDDILLPGFSENIASYLPKLQKNITINPVKKRYRGNFSDNNYLFTYFGLVAYPDGINRDDFLHLDIDRGMLMGISGITLHIDNYCQAFENLRFLTYGWRAEYFFLASKNITKICSTKYPLIGIREHPEATSAIVKWYNVLADEEIFYIFCHYTTACTIFKEKNFQRSKILYFLKHPLTMIMRILYRMTLKQIISVDMHKKFRGYAKKWLS